MLKPATLTFLKQLKNPKHNSKAWMDQHRDDADRARADLEDLAGRLITEVAKFDARIRHARLAAKDCVTRLNRDVRFHGGPAFKHDVHVILNFRGKKTPTAFYYVHVEPGRSIVGGGVFAPESRDLLKFREGVAKDFTGFKKIISAKAFKAAFPEGVEAPDRAKTIPRGFDADHPAASYLRLKGFYAKAKLTDRDLTSPASLKKFARALKAAKPLVDFLNDAYEASPKARGGRAPNPQFPR